MREVASTMRCQSPVTPRGSAPSKSSLHEPLDQGQVLEHRPESGPGQPRIVA